MKPLRKLTTACFAVFIILLLCKCRTDESGNTLQYDKEKAKEHIIPVDTAIKLTNTYKLIQKETARRLHDSAYIVNFPLAEKFNRDAILALLAQKGARGVRIYLGEDKSGPIKMVLVAVDDQGNDITGRRKSIMKFSSDGSSTTDAVVLEAGQRCPTLCDVTSVLNN